MASTGDMQNNLQKLQAVLKKIKFRVEDIDINSLSNGSPDTYLPIYQHAFTAYSSSICQLILTHSIEMAGKSSKKFLDAMYKALREVFHFKPPITKDQFLTSGFTERKVIMCTEILTLINDKHKELNPRAPGKILLDQSYSHLGGSSTEIASENLAMVRPVMKTNMTNRKKVAVATAGDVNTKLNRSLSTSPRRIKPQSGFREPLPVQPVGMKNTNVLILKNQRDIAELSKRVDKCCELLEKLVGDGNNNSKLDSPSKNSNKMDNSSQLLECRITLLENEVVNLKLKGLTKSKLSPDPMASSSPCIDDNSSEKLVHRQLDVTDQDIDECSSISVDQIMPITTATVERIIQRLEETDKMMSNKFSEEKYLVTT